MNTITIVRIITVVLKLTRISVSSVVSTVESVIQKMTGNPNFTSLNSLVESAAEKNEALRQSAATAKDGSKAQKADVKVKLRELLLLMVTLKEKVQTIANENPAKGEEVVISAGMAVKRFTPRPKRTFTVQNESKSGTIKTFCPRTKKDVVFGFEYTQTPDDVSSYIGTGDLPAATRIISDLESGKRYFVRWSSITSKGRSDWSEWKSIIVQ